MGYSLSDFAKDLATGGGYSATKAVTEGVADAFGLGAGAAADALGQVTGATAGAAAQGAGTPAGAAGQGAGNISGTISGTVSGNVSGAINSLVAGKELKYCCYAIEGDYLLNSETGLVWFIDKENKELVPFKRRMLQLESIANSINLDYMKQFLLNRKDIEIGKLHHSVRGDFSKHVDALVTAFDKEITENMKAGKK